MCEQQRCSTAFFTKFRCLGERVMIVPTPRLILLSALVALPACAVIPLLPKAAEAAVLVIALGTVVAAADAALGMRPPRALSIEAPAFVRLTERRAGAIHVVIGNALPHPLTVRIALVLPDGITSSERLAPVQAPAGRSSVDYAITGTTRGTRLLEQARIESRSLLGLWHVRTALALTCELRVYPDLRDRATAALFQRARAAGGRLTRQFGKGREFDRLRQFVPGDSIEDVHWKATAKRGVPVVKLFRLEHSQQVYVALDCSRLSALESRLDGYVDAALHLALCAEQQGDRFGLILFSDRVHRVVEARRGSPHFRLCRDAVYNAKPRGVNPDFAEVCDSLQRKLTRRSLIVFLTCLDDTFLAESFERDITIMARRHLLLVHLMRAAETKPMFSGDTPENLDGAYFALASQLHWNRIRRLQIALQNRGVRLSMLDPARAKEQVAAAYLDVKRRQLL